MKRILCFLFLCDLSLTFNAIDEMKTGDKTSFISNFIRTHIQQQQQQQPLSESHQIQRLPGNNRYVLKANADGSGKKSALKQQVNAEKI